MSKPCPMCGRPFKEGPSLNMHMRHCRRAKEKQEKTARTRLTRLEPGSDPLITYHRETIAEATTMLLEQLGGAYMAFPLGTSVIMLARMLEGRSLSLPKLPDTRGLVLFIETLR